jgi:hypothetical protein
VCGFHTTAVVMSDDGQHVRFDIQTQCEKIGKVAALLTVRGEIDAWQEISPNSASVVMADVRAVLKGCCAACAAPVGIFKAMQVAAGLALPQDISIKISKE